MIHGWSGFPGVVLEGSLLEVTLAKPVDKNDYVRYTRGAGKANAVPQVTVYFSLSPIDSEKSYKTNFSQSLKLSSDEKLPSVHDKVVYVLFI